MRAPKREQRVEREERGEQREGSGSTNDISTRPGRHDDLHVAGRRAREQRERDRERGDEQEGAEGAHRVRSVSGRPSDGAAARRVRLRVLRDAQRRAASRLRVSSGTSAGIVTASIDASVTRAAPAPASRVASKYCRSQASAAFTSARNADSLRAISAIRADSSRSRRFSRRKYCCAGATQRGRRAVVDLDAHEALQVGPQVARARATTPARRAAGAGAGGGGHALVARERQRVDARDRRVELAGERRGVDEGHRLQPLHVGRDRAPQRPEARPVETRELGVGELQRGERRRHVARRSRVRGSRARAPARPRRARARRATARGRGRASRARTAATATRRCAPRAARPSPARRAGRPRAASRVRAPARAFDCSDRESSRRPRRATRRRPAAPSIHARPMATASATATPAATSPPRAAGARTMSSPRSELRSPPPGGRRPRGGPSGASRRPSSRRACVRLRSGRSLGNSSSGGLRRPARAPGRPDSTTMVDSPCVSRCIPSPSRRPVAPRERPHAARR